MHAQDWQRTLTLMPRALAQGKHELVRSLGSRARDSKALEGFDTIRAQAFYRIFLSRDSR